MNKLQTILFACLLLLVVAACASKKQVADRPTPVEVPLPSIAAVKDVTDIPTVLKHSSFNHRFDNFRLKDSLSFRNYNLRKLEDSLEVPPFLTIDFDQNGQKDLLFSGKIDSSFILGVVFDQDSSFRTTILHKTSLPFEAIAQPVYEDTDSLLLVYYTDTTSFLPHYKVDSFVYKMGGFLPYNEEASNHIIDKISLVSSECFRGCEAFSLDISKLGLVSYKAMQGTVKEGSFLQMIDGEEQAAIHELINYLKFEEYVEEFGSQVVNCPTFTLTIDYQVRKPMFQFEKKQKTITHYLCNQRAPKGLDILYERLLELRNYPVYSTQLSSNENQSQTRRFDYKECLSQIDSLRVHYGKNKTIPSELELPALVALSHYPELKEANIIFKFKPIKATMAAAPKANFIFKKKKSRTYVISMANDGTKRKSALPVDIPFNGQIGVLGHELAHVAYYETKGIFPILRFGIGQGSEKFRERTEKETDRACIEHGLGWQLYDLRVCTNITSNPPKEFLEKKEKIYLTPKEIKEEL